MTDRAWNGEPATACGGCGTVKRPINDGLCTLCVSLQPEPIASIIPRVMADLETRRLTVVP